LRGEIEAPLQHTNAPNSSSPRARSPQSTPSTARTNNTQVYLDVKLEGQKLGRVVIELLPSVAPVGAERFLDLSVGYEGVGYRLARCVWVACVCVWRNLGVSVVIAIGVREVWLAQLCWLCFMRPPSRACAQV